MANEDTRKSPELRLVQGDCFEGRTADQQGKPYTDKSGQPQTRYVIVGAGRKGDPAVEAFKAMIEAEARAGFPHLFTGPGGTCIHPAFAYKIMDGDGVDQNGRPNNQKPGFAGHWVFKFGSNYAPRCFAAGKWAPTDQLQKLPGAPNPIPRGHYIEVGYTIKPNGDTQKPGMYLNASLVSWTRMGEVIQSGPDAAAVFGGGAAQPAAYAAPMAPAPAQAAYAAPAPMAPAPVAAGPIYTMTPAAGAFTREQYLAANHTDDTLVAQGFMTITHPMAPAPAAYVAPAPAPAPAAYVAPAPAPVVVQPHHAALAPAPLAPAGSVPAAPAPAPTAAAAPGFRMANPSGPTYAAYKQIGWDDAALVQNGHMVPL